MNDFKNKKVLIFGLGLLGGGVATTNWFLKQGAKVTVTDLKDRNQLSSSLRKIKGKVKLVLGSHNEKDIKNNDIIVFNPDISKYNPFVKLAKKLGKRVENEATIFYQNCLKPIIAITGTRGKTTTAIWTTYLLKQAIGGLAVGNSKNEPLLKALEKINKKWGNFYVVNELPSFHLEFFNKNIPAPKIVIITNIYRDHLNRYKSFEDYTKTKTKIFENQRENNYLILNYDDKLRTSILKSKPKSKIWFVSTELLSKKLDGVFCEDGKIYLQANGETEGVLDVSGFENKWGRHNLYNLLCSSLAANLAGVSWSAIQKVIGNLPQVEFRQEVIFENDIIKIINDTTATSPEGGMVSMERFGGDNCVLITGGTDRNLDFSRWARIVLDKIKKENLILLSGSATNKMIKLLRKSLIKEQILDNLEDCIKMGFEKATGSKEKMILLFSPASKSFEKFKNEYDRGEQFNKIVKKWTKNLKRRTN